MSSTTAFTIPPFVVRCVCCDFIEGKCKKSAEECPYEHDDGPSNAKPCQHGDDCKFKHQKRKWVSSKKTSACACCGKLFYKIFPWRRIHHCRNKGEVTCLECLIREPPTYIPFPVCVNCNAEYEQQRRDYIQRANAGMTAAQARAEAERHEREEQAKQVFRERVCFEIDDEADEEEEEEEGGEDDENDAGGFHNLRDLFSEENEDERRKQQQHDQHGASANSGAAVVSVDGEDEDIEMLFRPLIGLKSIASIIGGNGGGPNSAAEDEAISTLFRPLYLGEPSSQQQHHNHYSSPHDSGAASSSSSPHRHGAPAWTRVRAVLPPVLRMQSMARPRNRTAGVDDENTRCEEEEEDEFNDLFRGGTFRDAAAARLELARQQRELNENFFVNSTSRSRHFAIASPQQQQQQQQQLEEKQENAEQPAPKLVRTRSKRSSSMIMRRAASSNSLSLVSGSSAAAAAAGAGSSADAMAITSSTSLPVFSRQEESNSNVVITAPKQDKVVEEKNSNSTSSNKAKGDEQNKKKQPADKEQQEKQQSSKSSKSNSSKSNKKLSKEEELKEAALASQEELKNVSCVRRLWKRFGVEMVILLVMASAVAAGIGYLVRFSLHTFTMYQDCHTCFAKGGIAYNESSSSCVFLPNGTTTTLPLSAASDVAKRLLLFSAGDFAESYIVDNPDFCGKPECKRLETVPGLTAIPYWVMFVGTVLGLCSTAIVNLLKKTVLLPLKESLCGVVDPTRLLSKEARSIAFRLSVFGATDERFLLFLYSLNLANFGLIINEVVNKDERYADWSVFSKIEAIYLRWLNAGSTIQIPCIFWCQMLNARLGASFINMATIPKSERVKLGDGERSILAKMVIPVAHLAGERYALLLHWLVLPLPLLPIFVTHIIPAAVIFPTTSIMLAGLYLVCGLIFSKKRFSQRRYSKLGQVGWLILFRVVGNLTILCLFQTLAGLAQLMYKDGITNFSWTGVVAAEFERRSTTCWLNSIANKIQSANLGLASIVLS